MRGCRSWRGPEFLLAHLRRRLLDLDGRGLELERRDRSRGRAGRSVLRLCGLDLAFLGDRVGVHGSCGVEGRFGRVRREAWEAWGVGCGLQVQLGEVEVGAGFVAAVHGFHEAAFGPEAVEDDDVD